MRFTRPQAIALSVLAAGAVAAAGAAANLQLLEPRGASREPIVLDVSVTNGATATTAAGPSTTAPSGVTTTVVPPTTSTTTAAVVRSYVVGGAGTVTLALRAGTLALASVVPSAGWTATVEDQRAEEVEVSFRRTGGDGDGDASFHARLRGGEIRVEIEPEEGEDADD